MNYRSITDMNDTIVRNLHRLPRDIDLVVGIPRSGLIAANFLSLAANIPMTDLDGFVAGRTYSSGITKRRAALDRGVSDMRTVLVIDDSINGGAAMRDAREKIAASGSKADVIFSAVYGSYGRYEETDFIFEVVPWPRLFQWNFMHHKFLERSCVDIDGVLCLDPTDEENDDGPAYARFLNEARPLYRPTRKIGCLVTSRLEKYRPQTEAWLAAQGIAYGGLVMLDLPSKQERQRQAVHGRFKAEFYRGSDAELFIESEPEQAAAIASLSGKPVLCAGTHRMIAPGLLTTGLKQAKTAAGRQDLVKVAARTVLGERGYDTLKKWAKKPA